MKSEDANVHIDGDGKAQLWLVPNALWKVLMGKTISAKKVKTPHGFPSFLLYLTEVQASGRFSFWVCFLVLLEL